MQYSKSAGTSSLMVCIYLSQQIVHPLHRFSQLRLIGRLLCTGESRGILLHASALVQKQEHWQNKNTHQHKKISSFLFILDHIGGGADAIQKTPTFHSYKKCYEIVNCRCPGTCLAVSGTNTRCQYYYALGTRRWLAQITNSNIECYA